MNRRGFLTSLFLSLGSSQCTQDLRSLFIFLRDSSNENIINRRMFASPRSIPVSRKSRYVRFKRALFPANTAASFHDALSVQTTRPRFAVPGAARSHRQLVNGTQTTHRNPPITELAKLRPFFSLPIHSTPHLELVGCAWWHHQNKGSMKDTTYWLFTIFYMLLQVKLCPHEVPETYLSSRSRYHILKTSNFPDAVFAHTIGALVFSILVISP